MDRIAFEALKRESAAPERVININDLKDKTPRTLLYGYTADRDTWHVYINEHSDEIMTVVYQGKGRDMSLLRIEENCAYIPNKRLYPSCCDFEFCKLLKREGLFLPFTTWTDRAPEKYYGETY